MRAQVARRYPRSSAIDIMARVDSQGPRVASDSAAVLRALAHGIDPTSGEVLGDDSLFAAPVVVSALFDGAAALERSTPRNALPVARGWSAVE